MNKHRPAEDLQAEEDPGRQRGDALAPGVRDGRRCTREPDQGPQQGRHGEERAGFRGGG